MKAACYATNEYLASKYIEGTNDFVYEHLLGWGDPAMDYDLGERLCPELEQ
jgi:hypothetical protein